MTDRPESQKRGWKTFDAEPAIGLKFIALYDDGSGAAMFWRHDGGLIDQNGDDFSWPLKGYDRWAYLPDGLEFWCETTPEDPLTLTLPSPPLLDGGGDKGSSRADRELPSVEEPAQRSAGGEQ